VEHKLAHVLQCRLEQEDIARGGESKKLRVFLKPRPGHGLDKHQVADALCSSRVVILLVSPQHVEKALAKCKKIVRQIMPWRGCLPDMK
jgi:hypothetical protein